MTIGVERGVSVKGTGGVGGVGVPVSVGVGGSVGVDVNDAVGDGVGVGVFFLAVSKAGEPGGCIGLISARTACVL